MLEHEYYATYGSRIGYLMKGYLHRSHLGEWPVSRVLLGK